MMHLRLSALRHAVRSLLRSLRPPGDRIPGPEPILEVSVHPESVGDLLGKAELERRELLEMSKSLDRKLLAVITAGGVYAALLISVRGLIPGPAAGTAGVVAAAGIVLAYLAWRPNPSLAMTTHLLVKHIGKDPDSIKLVHINVYIAANHHLYGLNEWKARLFARSSTWVSVGSVATLLLSVGGGLL